MKIVKLFRCGKISNGLEVTKAELLDLSEKYSFISVSEADMNNLKRFDDSDIVGVIMGNIYNIKEIPSEHETVINPDCWFVFNPSKHGYKSLEKDLFTFGEAIELLKLGYKVARKGWNGKGMWLILQPTTPKVKLKEDSIYKKAGLDQVQIDAHIDMYTAQGTMQPGWLASQADMLSEDWIVVK